MISRGDKDVYIFALLISIIVSRTYNNINHVGYTVGRLHKPDSPAVGTSDGSRLCSTVTILMGISVENAATVTGALCET